MSEEIAPTVPFTAKLKFLAIGVVVGCVLGLGGVAKVWMDKNAEVNDAHALVQKSEAMMGETKAVASKAEGQARVLKARVAATQAAYDFQRQNYGTAGDYLKVARGHLDALDASVHGLDAAALDAVRASAKATTVDSAGDLNAQADAIFQLGKQLDPLIK